MSRRLLIIEPDAAGRAMMDRVLTAEGYGVDTAASALEARPLLDAGQIEAVIVDELAGSRVALDEVRWLRRKYPTLPLIVTGALLSRRVMQELIRLRVSDALAKPFTPDELREATTRVVEARIAQHEQALEYDVALTDARRAIAAGLAAQARAPLARAQAMSPFDSEIMALRALSAELEGSDDDADRGYRAALALRDEENSPPPDPHEGLARLAAYAPQGARPVAALAPERATQPLWLVTDPGAELRASTPPPVDGPHIVVIALGLGAEAALPSEGLRPADDAAPAPPSSRPASAIFLRDGSGPRAFALLAAALRPEPVAAALARLGTGPLVAAAPTSDTHDLARIEELRRAAAGAR